VKTAISIPDPTFRAAERHAATHNLSRSELYARALKEYLQRHEQQGITERINAICAEVETQPDAFDNALSVHVLEQTNEDWS
jgi:metal-responsive CopG/Arc/MetJ family transcriptional regulator